MSIDFSLCRLPNESVVIKDYFPLIDIFSGKRTGSLTTNRIKLRHQNIRFYVTYRKGQ